MTLSELSRTLGRIHFWVSGIQRQFTLPKMDDMPGTYVAFLRKIRDLENLGVSRERLVRLWELEQSLIRQLHLVPGNEFLHLIAGCSTEANPDRRLLLSNADLGVPLLARDLQPGLDFAAASPRELFGGREMGEDSVRSLGDYRSLLREVRETVSTQRKVLRESLGWEKAVGLSR